MSHYQYKCFSCSKEFSAEEIENNLLYLCTNCGKSETGKPLEGVLNVVYDYKYLSKKIDKDSFLNSSPGRIEALPKLLPLDFNNSKIKLHFKENISFNILSSNFISKVAVDDNDIFIFDDTRNITLSYKDRATYLVVLKALQLGINEITAASTGNAGSSLAGISARMGLKSHIFVPKNIPDSKRIQIQAFGANLYMLDGDYDQAFDLCMHIAVKKNWYNRNTGFNPLTIEGKKSSVFDMFIELEGSMPDNIFVPAGDGVIISGIYKGLYDLKKLGWINKFPKLFLVQAEGSDGICKYLESKTFEYRTAHTIADSISAGAPRNLYMAADAVEQTEGVSVRVSDEEIIKSQKILAEKGVFAEPAAAASLAGYNSVNEKGIIDHQKSLLMITGNGLKDISSLNMWNSKSQIKKYDEIVSELL